MTFPPKLLDSITQAVVKQFQLHLAEVAFDLQHICTSCGLFILVAEVIQLHRTNLIFQKGRKVLILVGKMAITSIFVKVV